MSNFFFKLSKLSILFVILVPYSYGQVKSIDIDSRINDKLLLTDIVEHVTPIVFEMHPDYTYGSIDEVEWADPYFFLKVSTWQGPKRISDYILQYTISGKFVREIGMKEGFTSLRGIRCDSLNKLLYFTSDKGDHPLIVYNFDGIFIKKVDSFAGWLSFIIYKNYVWAQYNTIPNDKKYVEYIFSKFNPQNMTEQKVHQFNDKEGIVGGRGRGGIATFSTFKDDLYVSFGVDYLIHQMQNNKLIPTFKITIMPNILNSNDRYKAGFRGFVGSYIFVNYDINEKSNFFIYNTNSEKGYNFSIDDKLNNQGIRDNVNGTGYITKLSKLNRPQYFYYLKSAGDLKEMPKNASSPNHPVVFIAKIKE